MPRKKGTRTKTRRMAYRDWVRYYANDTNYLNALKKAKQSYKKMKW